MPKGPYRESGLPPETTPAPTKAKKRGQHERRERQTAAVTLQALGRGFLARRAKIQVMRTSTVKPSQQDDSAAQMDRIFAAQCAVTANMLTEKAAYRTWTKVQHRKPRCRLGCKVPTDECSWPEPDADSEGMPPGMLFDHMMEHAKALSVGNSQSSSKTNT